jgi:hypothetical protein
VIIVLAEELAASEPLLTKDAFRALAGRIRDKTGQKGKALFHPIRLVLTGEAEGMELDLSVPAIEQGSRVLPRIPSAAQRAAAFVRLLEPGARSLEP